MNSTMNLFSETPSSEKIITKICGGEWNDIMNGVCNVKNNLVILDNNYFKYFASKETYDIILSHITNNIDHILSVYEGFIVHINMKNVTISDIDKHLKFIQTISIRLKDKYPKKLTKCYIHNAPFVFSQILNIISLFIDKETREKIEVVTKDSKQIL